MSEYLPSFLQLKYLWPIGVFAGALLLSISIWGANELAKVGYFNADTEMKIGSLISILAKGQLIKLSAIFYAGAAFIVASIMTAFIIRKLEYSN